MKKNAEKIIVNYDKYWIILSLADSLIIMILMPFACLIRKMCYTDSIQYVSFSAWLMKINLIFLIFFHFLNYHQILSFNRFLLFLVKIGNFIILVMQLILLVISFFHSLNQNQNRITWETLSLITQSYY